jgi:hypothetical protein
MTSNYPFIGSNLYRNYGGIFYFVTSVYNLMLVLVAAN